MARINEKINLVKAEAKNADLMFNQGNTKVAKELYTACAQGLLNLSSLTEDDQVFQSALKLKVEELLQKADACNNARPNSSQVRPNANASQALGFGGGSQNNANMYSSNSEPNVPSRATTATT